MNGADLAIAARNSITLEEFKTLLDVVNVYDPNDICHVYPGMGSPEFMQDVQSVFKKLLTVVKNHPDSNSGCKPYAQIASEVTLTQEESSGVTR